jgi:hypothetical protein
MRHRPNEYVNILRAMRANPQQQNSPQLAMMMLVAPDRLTPDQLWSAGIGRQTRASRVQTPQELLRLIDSGATAESVEMAAANPEVLTDTLQTMLANGPPANIRPGVMQMLQSTGASVFRTPSLPVQTAKRQRLCK